MADIDVLVVDDDAVVCKMLGGMLSREGACVSLAGNGHEALVRLERKPFQVLFTDLCMPEMDGLTVLRRALEVCCRLSAVVFTGHGGLDSCIEALRLGACDYLTKPFTRGSVQAALSRALRLHGDKCRALPLDPQGPEATAPAGRMEEPDDALVGQSPAICEVRAWITKAASSNASVLLCGEPGVGKHAAAQAIARQSRRAACPFVHVSCGAFREAELGPRLFGEEPPDAEADAPARPGLLARAHRGTLFLDHVERLPLWAQIELCDLVSRAGIERSSAFRPVSPDVRLMASTSSDLQAAVAEGRFYSDLYYLLSPLVLHVPPLRERQADLRALVERFLARIFARYGGSVDQTHYRFTPAAWESLLHYDWPGNLRELACVIARAVAMAEGPLIGKEALALNSRAAPRRSSGAISVPLTGSLQQIERTIIEETVQRCRGNKAAAARILGLHRRTLYRILEGHPGDPAAGEAGEGG